ncbi:UNVERIFIED_CONTAM: hypothetical protein FKN15_061828 [Acipenser sinensis]
MHGAAGSSHSKQDWAIQWPTSDTGKENNPISQPEPSQWIRFHLSQSPKVQSKYNQHYCQSPQSLGPNYMHVDRLTVESYPGLFPPLEGHRSLPPSPRQRHFAHTPPRTPPVLATMTPPGTPPMRRRNKLKAPGTPPPASRKLIHLLPSFTALHRSKSHEFQLGNRVDEAQTPNLLNLVVSPLLFQYFSSWVVNHGSCFSLCADTLSVPRWSPQIPRRDLGNSIKHRIKVSDGSHIEAVHCHSDSDEAGWPAPLILNIMARWQCNVSCKCLLMSWQVFHQVLDVTDMHTRLVRTESVPCDINNPLRRPPRYSDLHVSQTLPKTNKINKVSPSDSRVCFCGFPLEWRSSVLNASKAVWPCSIHFRTVHI